MEVCVLYFVFAGESKVGGWEQISLWYLARVGCYFRKVFSPIDMILLDNGSKFSLVFCLFAFRYMLVFLDYWFFQECSLEYLKKRKPKTRKLRTKRTYHCVFPWVSKSLA